MAPVAGRVAQLTIWVDIEDDAEVMEDIDVENFPLLLVARGDTVLYFGVLAPSRGCRPRASAARRWQPPRVRKAG